MINEIFKEMAMNYKRNKERESKLIGKKKSTIQANNFLFIPTGTYLDILKKSYNLKEENLKPLIKMVDKAVKKMERQIKELTLEIPISQDSEIDFDFIEVIKSFYTNKLLSNLLSTYLKADDIDIWIDDWIWDEFAMPFFLCSIMISEREKAVEHIVKLTNQSKGVNVSKGYSFVSKIREAKNKLSKQNPDKKISKRAVAKVLGIPTSTFYDKLKDNKIDFSKL